MPSPFVEQLLAHAVGDGGTREARVEEDRAIRHGLIELLARRQHLDVRPLVGMEAAE
jgi:hypothetical protein